MTLAEFVESKSHWCDDAPDGIVSLHIDEMKAIHAEAIRYGAEFSQMLISIDEKHADAKIRYAAHDLLAACEAAYRYHPSETGYVAEMLLKAIKKARG